jgi:predicted AlkP superfamily phosphohydrolase/phosphomutase/tetratricopeptide (TPR) repeat protein
MANDAADRGRRPKVLLIGWDGADWEHITPMLERGLLPTLDGLINQGVMGNLSTLQPVLSPMLWNSVATCKHADKHGVSGFIERDPHNGGARPFSSTSRKTKALWNILSQSGYRSNVINWWASHPAEKINGCIVSNLFGSSRFDPQEGWRVPSGTIHPAHLETPFAKFKVFPEELTQEHILPFIPDAARIDQEKDQRLTGFAKTLADTATTQSIATAVMASEPWDFMAIYYTGIDHFSHGFMQYHPPKMPNISDEDFQLYKGVIEGAYQFHDMMLETLLAQVDDDTTVILCSDHGFHSREFRPLGVPREPAGPAIWHRKYGILVMKGPGILRDQRIYGASLIDVGPTILSLFDLPVGDDMDGRPLLEAFENPPEVKTIESWDLVPGDDGFQTGDAPVSKAEADELLKQFVALGYIDDPGEDKEKQALSADCESKYNLARSLMWQGKFDAALPLLSEITHQWPWENRFIVQWAECCLGCGYIEQARAVIESAFDLETTNLSLLLALYSKILIRLGDHDQALRWLSEAERRTPQSAEVYLDIGGLFARQRKWTDAIRNFRKALELNPDNAIAMQALSTAYLRTGENQLALDLAFDAIGYLHRLPRAHLNIGVVMMRSQDYPRAEMALKTALQFAPKSVAVHRWLAYLYDQLPDATDRADRHRMQVQVLTDAARTTRGSQTARKSKRFDLPDFGTEEERKLRLIEERPNPRDKVEPSGKTFVVVSGLPRSGTSLMMQMLDAGGVSLITDHQRTADVDNPKGYLEWEAIKKIADQPDLLDAPDHEGKAFKAVSMLLKSLPKKHAYRVIFMVRPVEEVVESQGKMIRRLGTDGGDLNEAEMTRGLRSHLNDTVRWMKAAPNVEFIAVQYPSLVANPESVVPALCEFLGDTIRSPAAMSKVVDQDLYRNRQPESTDSNTPASHQS